MNNSEVNKPYELKITLFCQLDNSKIEILKKILSELINLTGENYIESLRGIFITEKGKVTNSVDSIIKVVEPSMSYIPREICPLKAITIPIEVNGELHCFIVMSEELLEDITPKFEKPFNLISTLLEELLHVKVYTSHWKRRGYIQYTRKGLACCEIDILHIASFISDEYVVLRLKSRLFSTNPLFQTEPEKELCVAKLSYGSNLIEEISSFNYKLKKLATEIEQKKKSILEAWLDVTNILKRNLLEPLARSSAYYDEENENFTTGVQLKTINTNDISLSNYWDKIHLQLMRIFESNLIETEIAIKVISDQIIAFLQNLGITYIKKNSQCVVRFEPIFF